jgi:prepilin-type processing-associated H-X9-DG protein
MSNQLATPKILYCTLDLDHSCATNFSSDFSAKNISYFVGVDADRKNPASILDGDDNFMSSEVPVKFGLLAVSANTSIGWTAARHKYNGNIGFADGSVQETTSAGLAANFTNNITRLAIP